MRAAMGGRVARHVCVCVRRKSSFSRKSSAARQFVCPRLFFSPLLWVYGMVGLACFERVNYMGIPLGAASGAGKLHVRFGA